MNDNINELKEILSKVSVDTANELRNFLWDEIIIKSRPTVSVKKGQIVKWKSPCYNNRINVGVSIDQYDNAKSFIVLYYMEEYDCYREIRVDADAKELEITNEFINLSVIDKMYNELNKKET